MKAGCIVSLIAFASLLVACAMLNRSETITRGLELDQFTENGVTYRVWSYGEWVSSYKSGVHVSTFEGPYKIVVSIEPLDEKIEQIEIVSAEMVSESGVASEISDKLHDSVEVISRDDNAHRALNYAPFIFDEAVLTNSDLVLRLNFTMKGEGIERQRAQELKISGFEEREKGFLILDQIMGI